MSFVATPPPAVTLASWGRRAGGGLIDLFSVVPLPFLGLLFVLDRDSAGGDSPFALVYVLLTLLSWAILGYNRWVRGGRTGQSWGRKARGTRLVDERTGRPIGVRRAFLRDLAHAADAATWYLGFLLPLWDDKRQTLADKIMKTVVVHPA
jgi:uncharacterized RDD family membrane protein YckC